MADGGEQLPPNEELFEQQPEEQQQVEQMDIGEDDLAVQNQQEYHQDSHASGTGEVVNGQEEGYQIDDQQNRQPYYHEQPQQQQANHSELFMPADYVEPEHEEDGEHFVVDPESGAPVDLENSDATVWVDSPEDQDPEEHILRANFWLPYSDHNYDPPNPKDRVDHPMEGPFPIIDGLDEEGNIRNQWMPDGYGPPYRPGSEEERQAAAAAAAEDAAAQQAVHPSLQLQDHMQQQQQPVHHLQQQYSVAPMRQSMSNRPMVTAQPFSIGGNQVEYADAPPQPQRALPRGHMVAPQQQPHHQPQFRIANASDYTSPQGVRTQRGGPPMATIIRSGGAREQQMYQTGPAGSASRLISMSRGGPVASSSQPTPGSYQHIGGPTPLGIAQTRRIPPGMRPERNSGQGIITGPGIVRQSPQQGPNSSGRTIPVGVVGPHNTPQVDYDGPPGPPQQAAPPARRAVADVAPHRMTPEQRQEQQQQMARQRTQGSLPIRTPIGGVQGRTTIVPGRGRVMGMPTTGAPEEQQQLLRSPQRVQGQPSLEQHRRLKLPGQQTEQTSYTVPVVKSNSNDNQLPAQLTEDPEEQPVRRTSESQQQKAPEPAAVAQGPTTDIPAGQQVAEEPIKQMHKSPARLPSSASSSPVKHHIGAGIPSKPTPPHRLTLEEKNAHFAKLTSEKERPPPLQAPPTSSATVTAPGASPAHHHQQHHPPQLQHPQSLPQRHHQDDTLAVVQSVFDPTKPRLPDTPKDKEAISKIADQLRFSADAFTGASGSSSSAADQHRHRTTSGGHHSRAHNYAQMHQQMGGAHLQHQQNMDQMAEEARRKRNLSGGVTRYDAQNPSQMPGMHHPIEGDQHRPRGRPRGSTGAGRWPDGQEPIAPHRAAGGARTLQPRSESAAAARQQPPPKPAGRNGAVVQKDSDSESDGVHDSESWAMRCHCEMDHGVGDCVECEKCKTWQHMYCMGLTPKSNTDNYKCEQCEPRRLPVSRSEARRKQREILKEIAAVEAKNEKAKKQKSRKSEPADSKKSRDQQPSTSRKSAPMPSQPLASPSSHTMKQLNTYSKAAQALLLSMPQTAGADTLLEESRKRARAKRMYVAEQVEALVTVDVVSIRQVIIEVNGYVSMAAEIKRLPGGGNATFMYDGLMKGTTGEDVGERQELVCIDTKKKGNDSQYTRRSCMPNCVLKHVLGSQATLGIMVVATKDIMRNVEVTLPFDADWKSCEQPLACAEHSGNISLCTFEQERLRANMSKMRAREIQEKKRQEDEERRRLEEEVRREREAKTRQMDEEQERLEREQKQKEKEEAKKKREEEKQKREAEKKAEMEKKIKKEEEEAAGPSEKVPKDDKKVKREKSPSPVDSDAPSTSEAATRRSGRARKERNLEIVDTPAAPSAPEASAEVKNGKRKNTASAARASSVKRQRQSSDRDAAAAAGPSTSAAGSRKRGTAKTDEPKAKKQKEYRVRDLFEHFVQLPYDPNVFTPGEDIMNSTEQSPWAKKLMQADVIKAKAAGPSESAPSSSGASSSSKKKEVPPSPAVQKESGSRKRSEPLKTVEKKTSDKSPEKSVEKKEEKKEQKKTDVAGPAPSPAPRAARSSAPSAPVTPKSTPQAQKAQEAPRSAAKNSVVASPKKDVQKPAEPSTDGSAQKESAAASSSSTGPAAAATTPASTTKAAASRKKLSMEDYKARRSVGASAGAASSSGATTPSSATPAGARRGFIPSTEGLRDVKLSAIPLDDHPAGKNTATTTTAPSAPSSSSAAQPGPSPSTRTTRARAAPSESGEEPAAHQMSLQDRLRDILGPQTGLLSGSSAPQSTATTNATATSASPVRKSTRPSRWNQ